MTPELRAEKDRGGFVGWIDEGFQEVENQATNAIMAVEVSLSSGSWRVVRT
jgi:hypothetical protein